MIHLVSGENISSIYRWILALRGRAFHLLLTLLFMLITLFFLFKDGDRMVRQLDMAGARILPDHWYRFSRVVPAAVSSTVIGMGLIAIRSEEHTSELQSRGHLVCRLLLEKK